MSGIFRSGQLVSPVGWMTEGCDLFNTPGGASPGDAIDPPRVIGQLCHCDVALVVAIDRADCSAVYVIGPHGGGWAFGAFLTVVRGTE